MKNRSAFRGFVSVSLAFLMAVSCLIPLPAEASAVYAPESQYYDPAYNLDLFYNDKNDAAAYISNAMWHMFGAIDDGRSLQISSGERRLYFLSRIL